MHQICEDAYFQAVIPTIRRPWGGKTVNDEFLKFLSELVGERAWQEFKMNHMEEYLKITRAFEAKKRTLNPEKVDQKIRMHIPGVFIDLCTTIHGVNTFKDVIEKKNLNRNDVDYIADKLALDCKFFCGFFKKTINGIIKLMDEYIQTFEGKNVKCVVIVGGFSQCLLLRNAINTHFGNTSIIIPDRSDLVVLNGAIVLAMHIPTICAAKIT